MRHAILIAGMHRSGTSALARVVNLFGAELGEGLLPPKIGNPRGYWEAEAVVALNDECLDHFGLSWDEPWPLPHGWLDEPWVRDWQRRVADYVTAQFDRMPLFAIKDPRLSRLLPAWLALLHELDIAPQVLVSVRNPPRSSSTCPALAPQPCTLPTLLLVNPLNDFSCKQLNVISCNMAALETYAAPRSGTPHNVFSMASNAAIGNGT